MGQNDYYREPLERLLKEHELKFYFHGCERVTVMTAAHAHTFLEIIFVKSGRFLFDLDGDRFMAEPGDLILIPSGTIHSIYHLEARAEGYYVFQITSELLLRFFRGGESERCLIPFLRRGEGARLRYSEEELPESVKAPLFALLDEHENKESRLFSKAAAKSLLCLLIVSLGRAFFPECAQSDGEAAVDERLRGLIYRSLEDINLNYASDLTAEECARRVHLSYSYYARLFRAVTGKTFKEHLVGLRLAKAYNALLVTDLPVTEIALSCGYKSPAFFIAEFKKHYKITPREMRKTVPR